MEDGTGDGEEETGDGRKGLGMGKKTRDGTGVGKTGLGMRKKGLGMREMGLGMGKCNRGWGSNLYPLLPSTSFPAISITLHFSSLLKKTSCQGPIPNHSTGEMEIFIGPQKILYLPVLQ